MALSRKQQAALSRCSGKQRAKVMAGFRAQSKGGRYSGNGKTNGNGYGKASRALGEIVLAPGVGKVPRNPFGSVPGYTLSAWDALHVQHMPLPRSVGPYAVVRVTRIFRSNSQYSVFGVAVNNSGAWTNTGCFQSINPAAAINAVDNCYCTRVPTPTTVSGEFSTTNVVPAAMTVQVMNPNPLQTTNGLVIASVCPTMLQIIDNTRPWEGLADKVVSYMKPRMLSAPKLALRGVQMQSYPMNMSAMANFEKMQNVVDGPVTLSSSSTNGGDQYLCGLAPMVVCNEDEANLTYAMTVEYRVRFDIANPAVASHVHHGISSDKTWDNMVKAAVNLGNGVRDIADVVASAGQAINSIRNARLPQLPMLVD